MRRRLDKLEAARSPTGGPAFYVIEAPPEMSFDQAIAEAGVELGPCNFIMLLPYDEGQRDMPARLVT